MSERTDHKLPKSILFTCAQNCVRSPMAAALMRHFYGDVVVVESAGLSCGMPDGFVVAVMAEMGIDLNAHEPKTFGDLEEAKFEQVIALAPEALGATKEVNVCGSSEVEYWPMPDPTVTMGNREQRLEAYRGVRDALLKKIRETFGETSASGLDGA